MRRLFSYLFLAVLVLGIFYPSIFAESLSTDDQAMIRGSINMTGLDWQALFWPTTSPYYYRPLLSLSFYCDHVLSDNNVSSMHLGNILLHLANTLLLYVVLGNVISKKKVDFPLLVAIFFGIHPLVAEPVNWISGRTDLLAGFFVLLSFLFFLRNSKKKPGWDLLAAFLYLCGLWSKEVAIGLLPVILFFSLQEQHFALQEKWRSIASRVVPFFTATLIYGIMRTGGRFTHDIGVMTAIHGGHGAEDFLLSSKFLSLIKAIGFYSQKILWPFPLNFAIIEINRPVALAVGIIVLASLAVALLFFRRRPFMLGLVWIACFLAPALPVAVNRVAWTPLAERYLYLPLMGLCLVMVILMAGSSRKKIISLGLVLLLFGFGTATAQRNIVWQKNITLWQDVVEKSPNFAVGHNDYALALWRQGKKQEAEKHFALAESLTEGSWKNLAKSNIAMIKGDIEQQLAMLDEIQQNEKSPKLRKQVLYKMIRLINNKLTEKKISSEKQQELTRKLLFYQNQLASMDNNPYHLYRIGQLHLVLGEKKAAQTAFAAACESSNDFYTQPACTLAKTLAEETKGE
jgi:tetratricopeptide (TPR) repeat protein